MRIDVGVAWASLQSALRTIARPAIRVGPLATALAGLALYFSFNGALWHKIDHRPPRCDEAHCLEISQHSYQALQHGDWRRALSLKGVSDTKPGLVPFLSALSYFVVGDSERWATWLLNLVTFLVTCYALLRLAKDLTGGVAVGVVACLLFWNIPLVIVWSHYYQLDLPLTAAVCATVALCVALDKNEFQGWFFPALLGLTITVGMGAKHLYPGFVAAPLALLLSRSVVRSAWPPRVSLRGRWVLLACVAGGVLLGAAYHALNWHIVYEHILRSRDSARTGWVGTPPSVWLCATQLVAPFAVSPWWWVGAAGTGAAVLAARGRWLVAYVALVLVGGVACVARVASWPMANYLLPIVPLVALLVGGVVAWPRLGGWLGNSLTAVRLAALCLVGAALVSHHSRLTLGTDNFGRIASRAPAVLRARTWLTTNPLSKGNYWGDVYVPGNTALQVYLKGPDGLGERPWLCVPGNTATLPFPHYWPGREMVRTIADARAALPHPRTGHYVVGYNTEIYEWLCGNYLQFKFVQMRLQDRLALAPVPPDVAPATCLRTFDFLLLKSGPVYVPDLTGTLVAQTRQARTNQLVADDYRLVRESGFLPLARFALPDGSEGTVWIAGHVSPAVPELVRSLAAASAVEPSPGTAPLPTRSGGF